MDKKRIELSKYSNINKVQEKAKKLGLNPVEISSRKDKKYMIRDDNGDVKHFGQMLYHDFTKHNDEKRRDDFKSRNASWSHASKYTPSSLSYNLLW